MATPKGLRCKVHRAWIGAFGLLLLATPSFAGLRDTFEPWHTTRGRDGNFYGTMLYSRVSGGEVYRLSPSGRRTSVHTFTRIFGSPTYMRGGSGPEGILSVGQDGSIFGATRNGGVFGTGLAYQITRSGKYRSLISIPSFGYYREATLAHSRGDLLFSSSNGYSILFRLRKDGTQSQLVLSSSSYVTALAETLDRQILVAVSGNNNGLYRLTDDDRLEPISGLDAYTRTLLPQSDGSVLAMGNSYLLRILPDGSIDPIHSFDTQFLGIIPNFLTVARDGSFIGSTFQGGVENSGVFFRILPASKTYTAVKSLPANRVNGPGIPWMRNVFPHRIAAESGNCEPMAVDDVVPASSLRASDGGLPTVSIRPLANDRDTDRDRLSIVSIGQPQHGLAELDFLTQTITYSADSAEVQNDQFEYTIVDGNGGTSIGHVLIRTKKNGRYAGVLSTRPNAATGDPGTQIGSIAARITNGSTISVRMGVLQKTFRAIGRLNEINVFEAVLQANPRFGTQTSLQLVLRPQGSAWVLDVTVQKNGLRYYSTATLEAD